MQTKDMPNVHFIGIGGSGLSAIATVLLQRNYRVSGSDIQASAATARLEALGATVYIGHRPENLAGAPETVIISSAIGPDNVELVEARRRGLPVVKRADWLGHIMAGSDGIAVAGTHGKTTTTAMIAYLLQTAGQQPTYIVGGYVPQLQANAAAGQGRAFVIEADEYDHMFLGLRPQVAILTIAEWDHPDIFPTAQALTQAFVDFVQLVPANGLIIGCGDAPGVATVVQQAQAPVVTYGLQAGNSWQAVDLRPNSQGGTDFRIIRPDAAPLPASLAVPGRHNVLNALAAIIAAQQQGVEPEQSTQILAGFQGVERRFQLKGKVNGITVIDDYAHHPTEIEATLAAARTRFGSKPIWAVFQPHTFSRTRLFAAEFAAAFADADHVIVVDIFPSREKDEGLIHSRDIVARMDHPDARYIGPLAAASDYLVDHLSAPAVLLTLGAGDGYKIGESVLAKLEQGAADGAGGVGGVPPRSSPRQTPGMKPPE